MALTRARNYDANSKTPTTFYPPQEEENSLHIEKPPVDVIPIFPKGVLHKSTHNPHARAAQNNSIVEDLAQAPCAMSALEVLQSLPLQGKYLFNVIGQLESILLYPLFSKAIF